MITRFTRSHHSSQRSPLRSPGRFLRRSLALALALAAGLGSHARLSGQELDEILEELNGPITLALESGSQQSGQVVEWDGQTMRLEVSIGGGSAEFTFKRDEIREIAFPGGTYISTLYQWTQIPDRHDHAMRLFRAYYEQRGPFFDLMEERDLILFLRYANFALEQKEPIRAVAMIDQIRPHIENPELLAEIEENLMLAFFDAGMLEEAKAKAAEWTRSAEPAGPSALGWRLLAELSFREEDYEGAFWTALYPVAFSNQMPMNHLNACYAFAITAAAELRLKEPHTRLILEMRHRGLPWPEDVEALRDRAPELFTGPIEALEAMVAGEDTDASDEGTGKTARIPERPPMQTPSPLDPIQSLPTRINL